MMMMMIIIIIIACPRAIHRRSVRNSTPSDARSNSPRSSRHVDLEEKKGKRKEKKKLRRSEARERKFVFEEALDS